MSGSPHPAVSREGLLAPRLSASPAGRKSHSSGGPAAGPLVGVRPIVSRLLAFWHLFSLDAPSVATVWVLFIARSAGLSLPWTEPAAMFVAVWILYVADRLLDARAVKGRCEQHRLEERHCFHDRHRAAFRTGIAVALPLLLWLLRETSPSVLRLDFLLGGLLLLWLLLVHLRSAAGRADRLPKELAVGVFFPAAIFIPAVARLPALRLALLPDALLFGAVCSLNCLYIFAWEHPDNRDHAHVTTRWAAEHLAPLTISTLSAALLIFVAVALPGSLMHGRVHLSGTFALPAFACALSAALLLLVHRSRDRMPLLLLRASADLCLLTPALLLPAFALLAR